MGYTMPSRQLSTTRRGALAAVTGVLGSLAGCSSSRSDDGDRPDTTRQTTRSTDTTARRAEDDLLVVHADGSLYRVVRDLAGVWNRNPVPGTPGYWTPGDHDIDTDARLADYFASHRGLAPTGDSGRPPVRVAAAPVAEEPASRDLVAGRIDLAGVGSESLDELFRGEAPSQYEPGVVARHGSCFAVSPALLEDGLGPLTPDEVRSIYAGEVGNWRAVGGPDRDIYVLTGADVTPSRQIRRGFFGGVELSLDRRLSRPEHRLDAVRDRRDAITDLPAGGTDPEWTLPLVVDGRTVGPRDAPYPTTYAQRLVAWGRLEPAEAAFVDALQSRHARAFFDSEDWLVGVAD